LGAIPLLKKSPENLLFERNRVGRLLGVFMLSDTSDPWVADASLTDGGLSIRLLPTFGDRSTESRSKQKRSTVAPARPRPASRYKKRATPVAVEPEPSAGSHRARNSMVVGL
jgi:hypothetical protein